MNKKPYIVKRIAAYVLDILVVSVVAFLLTVFFPSNKEYEENYDYLLTVAKQYQNKEITEEEYLVLYDEISYELSRTNVTQTIVIVAVTILYFVVFNYYNSGQTLGKKLMNIKIVSIDNDKLTINNYLIRTLVGNTALSNIVTIILILSLSKENYMVYDDKVSTVFSVIYVFCFVLILYRNDGRGLHDLLASTKVVNVEKEVTKVIKEAEVVKEQNELMNEVTITENVEPSKSKIKSKNNQVKPIKRVKKEKK